MGVIALTGSDFVRAAEPWVDDDGDHCELREIRERRGNIREHARLTAAYPGRSDADRRKAYTRCGRLLPSPGMPLAYERWRGRIASPAGTVEHPEDTTERSAATERGVTMFRARGVGERLER